MSFSATHKRNEALITRAKHATRHILVMYFNISCELFFQVNAPRFGQRVNVIVGLEFGCLKMQMIEFKRLFTARIVVFTIWQLVKLCYDAWLIRSAFYVTLNKLILIVASVCAFFTVGGLDKIYSKHVLAD